MKHEFTRIHGTAQSWFQLQVVQGNVAAVTTSPDSLKHHTVWPIAGLNSILAPNPTLALVS